MSSAKFPWVAFATAAARVAAQAADVSSIFRFSDHFAAGRTISRSGGIDGLGDWYAGLDMDRTCTEVWGYTLLYASTPPSARPARLGDAVHRRAGGRRRGLRHRLCPAVPVGHRPPQDRLELGERPSDAGDVGIIELGEGRAYAISVVAHGGPSGRRSTADRATATSPTRLRLRIDLGHPGHVRTGDAGTPARHPGRASRAEAGSTTAVNVPPALVRGAVGQLQMITGVGEGWALLEGAEQDGYASNQYAYRRWTKNFGVLTAVDDGEVKEHSGHPSTFDWVLDGSGYFVPA